MTKICSEKIFKQLFQSKYNAKLNEIVPIQLKFIKLSNAIDKNGLTLRDFAVESPPSETAKNLFK